MKRSGRHSGTMPLVLALSASVAVHIFVLTPLLMAAMSPRSAAAIAAELTSLPPEDESTPIGIEQSDASTLDWIGYAEFQEHLAELSEMNQAAFTEQPSTPAPLAEAAVESPAEAAEVEPVAPLAANEETTETTEATEPAAEAESMPEAEAEAAPDVAPAAIEIAPPQIDLALLLAAAREWAVAAWRQREAPTQPDQAAAPREPAPQPIASPAQPASNPAQDSPGDPAEMESDPSSVIEVTPEQWVLGKPLAAGGLELFPQKPSFTLLTRMTAAVGNPVALLEFDRRGIVVNAELIRSSGHSQVDKNIIDSLFGWRARGKPLEAIPPGETFSVTMQFLLVD